MLQFTPSNEKEFRMATVDTKKLVAVLLAGLNLLLAAQTLQAAEAKQAKAQSDTKRHKLAATLETT
jgi:hypothetical protein